MLPWTPTPVHDDRDSGYQVYSASVFASFRTLIQRDVSTNVAFPLERLNGLEKCILRSIFGCWVRGPFFRNIPNESSSGRRWMEKVAEFSSKYSTRYSATYLVQRCALYISEIPLETLWSGARSITQMAVFRWHPKNRVRSLLKPYTTFAIVVGHSLIMILILRWLLVSRN